MTIDYLIELANTDIVLAAYTALVIGIVVGTPWALSKRR